MTVVPDSVGVVEGWRSWRFAPTGLKSMNGQQWTAGEELAAHCTAPNPMGWVGGSTVFLRWEVVKGGGRTAEEAAAYVDTYAGHQWAPTFSNIPRAELPPGYGYELVADDHFAHDCPSETCSCGIYAGTDMTVCLEGDVFGKVKMWGKVIPGEKGWRAQYAYPSELHVPARLANHPALLAYGVPIVVEADPPETAAAARLNRTRRFLYCAVGVNIVAVLTNLTVAGWHLW